MYSFRATIHARPTDLWPSVEMNVGGRAMQVLSIPQATVANTAMNCNFESACERLAALERMFCEPDGSFVWTSSHDDSHWQVDGNLYDLHGKLSFVDIRGNCPKERFDELLSAMGWPDTPLVFQLTHEAVLLDEQEFRRVTSDT